MHLILMTGSSLHESLNHDKFNCKTRQGSSGFNTYLPVSSTGGHVLTSTAAAASRDRNNLHINCVVIKQAERLTWEFNKQKEREH